MARVDVDVERRSDGAKQDGPAVAAGNDSAYGIFDSKGVQDGSTKVGSEQSFSLFRLLVSNST